MPTPQGSNAAFDRQNLSAEASIEVAARVAELARAGLPLGEGLRAMAGELSGRRARRALTAMADRIEAGRDLADAMAEVPHLRGLVLAGVRSGRLAEVLEEYVDLQRSRTELIRRVMLALSYPTLLLAMLAGLAVFVNARLVGLFAGIYAEWGNVLPDITQLFMRLAWPMAWVLVFVLAGVLAIPVALAAAPRVRWAGLALQGIPGIGPILRWGHMVQFSRFVALLIGEQVPLAEALRLTSHGLGDADLAYGCHRAADRIEAGQSLDEAMAAEPQFPPSLIPVVAWGQRHSTLADAFRAAAEMFDSRARSQSSLLENVLPSVMCFAILAYMGMFFAAIMLPMASFLCAFS